MVEALSVVNPPLHHFVGLILKIAQMIPLESENTKFPSELKDLHSNNQMKIVFFVFLFAFRAMMFYFLGGIKI